MRHSGPKAACAWLVWLAIATAPAAGSAQWELLRGVLGGGATKASSAQFGLRGTLAQTAISTVHSPGYVHQLGFWHSPGALATGVPPVAPIAPDVYSLQQNHPNPFNPRTTIRFDLPRTSHATLAIYNLRGQLVRMLIDQTLPAGSHQVQLDGQDLGSGVYAYRLRAGSFEQTRTLVLIK